LARRDHASEDLRRKLLDKGYDPTVVADLIERLCSEKLVDDRRFLESFISYRAARGQGPHRVRAELRTHYADKQRQAQFLGYRGFTGAQIRLALGFDTDIDVDT
jgi:SOS response regulatory protein OraA/RecX